jgi:hypothetical protein
MRIEAGIPILPMSWNSAPSSTRLSCFASSPSARPTSIDMSQIHRACDEV